MSDDVIYSRHSFGRVTRLGVHNVDVVNENGKSWTLDRSLFDAEFVTAGPHAEVADPVSRTEMLGMILANPKTAMTITFRKKVEAKEVSEGVREFMAGDDPLKGKKLEKKIKELLEGEVRTLSGYLRSGQLNEHGRLDFTSIGEGPRQVDPRTVEQLTVLGRTFQVRP